MGEGGEWITSATIPQVNDEIKNEQTNIYGCICVYAGRMVIIKGKIIDSRHLELSEEIQGRTGDIYLKIVEKDIVDSIRGGWGFDIDSAEFVENLRKSKSITSL